MVLRMLNRLFFLAKEYFNSKKNRIEIICDLVTESCLTLVTSWTIACKATLSMGFSRQGHWSGLPFPSLGALPDPGIKSGSPALQADSLLTELQGKPLK